MTGAELRAWRTKHEFGQQELADRLGVHLQTVSKWEREIQAIPEFLSLALQTIEREKLAGKKKSK